MEALKEEIFSAIPMPTWRWLGVNEAKVPAGINIKEAKRQEIVVAAGQQRTLSRQERAGASELHIRLEPGAEKIFRGTLDFLQGTKGSVGRENEEVLLLSEDVRNRSVPLMLSHEDEVDGHHAVSVGQMDEGKLFYLMSRGIPEDEARSMIVSGFANPVSKELPLEYAVEMNNLIKLEMKGNC